MLHQTPAPLLASRGSGQVAQQPGFPLLEIHTHMDTSGRVCGSTTAVSAGNAAEGTSQGADLEGSHSPRKILRRGVRGRRNM